MPSTYYNEPNIGQITYFGGNPLRTQMNHNVVIWSEIFILQFFPAL